MLDDTMLVQLREVFGSLTAAYTFVVSESTHEKQADLLSLLTGLASASPKLNVVVKGPSVATVHFAIHRVEARASAGEPNTEARASAGEPNTEARASAGEPNTEARSSAGEQHDGVPTGVSFRGVPGGHEFTSLVLSVLHADGKGKLPDPGIRARVAALRGPAALRTYVSLSCTNCPDVVQAMNLIALLHPGLTHEMVDGELCQEEVERLGLQGVPAVFAGEELVHVGKGSFAELVELLEQKLGRDPALMAAASNTVSHYDVVVVGGGPAGASAAIYSARKGLRTAIVAQKFGGQVQETLGIENLIGTAYTEGPRLVADLEKHVRSYPIDVLEHRRVERIVDGPEKELLIQGGERIRAGTLIVATGAKWRELNVPGEKEHLGHGVAFCPHCDGPFYKGLAVAVVGGGNSGVEAAIDLSGICSHVTLIEFADVLKADAVLVKNLAGRANVTVINSARTTEVLGEGGKVVGLRYEDRVGSTSHDVAVDGIFVQIGLSPNSALVRELVECNRMGEIVVDDKGRTSVAGIYAAGDVTTVPFKQIVIAMGEGAKAALTAFEDRMRGAAAGTASQA